MRGGCGVLLSPSTAVGDGASALFCCLAGETEVCDVAGRVVAVSGFAEGAGAGTGGGALTGASAGRGSGSGTGGFDEVLRSAAAGPVGAGARVAGFEAGFGAARCR